MNQLFKALNDPTRRRMLELLGKEDMSAGEIADHFDTLVLTLYDDQASSFEWLF